MTDINRTACTFSRPALNANTLKLIAVLAMVLDHAATVFLADTPLVNRIVPSSLGVVQPS